MSLLGIATSALLSSLPQSHAVQTTPQKIQQDFQQLGQDLHSGNLSAAQSDFATLRQDFQTQTAQSQSAHGHHHHHRVSSNDSSTATVSQLFNELGSALLSGSLTNAQQAYSSLQQDLAQFAPNSTATPAMSGVSLRA